MESIVQNLRIVNMPDELVALMQKLYENQMMTIKWRNKLSETTEITKRSASRVSAITDAI